MTKRVLVHANDLEESQQTKKQFIQLAQEAGLSVVSFDENPDYILSIGGDGTFISVFHKYQDLIDSALFIGVHTGSLGFYTDWLADELEELVQKIKNSDKESISYPLLDVEIQLEDGQKIKSIALNELAIRSIRRTMVSDIYISGSFFETFRGDGVCVSTPTGSTALNKSLGGAVVNPQLDAIQMTEIASINSRVYRTLGSPIIIGQDDCIVLEPSKHNDAVDLTIDNLYYKDLNIKSVQLQISSKRIHFAGFRHTKFWDRVRHSFIGDDNKEKGSNQ